MSDQDKEREWKDVDPSSAAQWLESLWDKTKDSRLHCAGLEDTAWTLAQYHAHESSAADIAFCKAMTTEGLERFDVLFDAVVVMYESQDYKGMDRLMDLALGTHNRGYVRTVLVAVKSVKHVVSEEKYDRLVDFLRKGNEERKTRGWTLVEKGLPEIEDGADPLGRAMSRKVLVKYRLSNGVGHSVDQMYYQNGEAPRWFKMWDTVVAWMYIPEE